MEYEIYKADDELTHWGVRGMKWGIRRYQNKDGSLTKAGQRRYKAESEKLKQEEAVLKKRKATKAKFDRLAAKRKAIEDEKKALDEAEGKVKKEKKGLFGKKKDGKDEKPKTAKDMTDEELILAINRARLEDTYNHLRPEQVVEKPKFMSSLMDDVVTPALKSSGRKALEGALNKIAEKALEGKVDPDSLEALRLARDKMQARMDTEKYKRDLERYRSGKPDEESLDDQKKRLEIRKMQAELDDRERRRSSGDGDGGSGSGKHSNKRSGGSDDSDNVHSGSGGKKDTTSRVDPAPTRSTQPKSNTTSSKSTSTQPKSNTTSSKSTSTRPNYPNDSEWSAFKSKYSWGVDDYSKRASTGKSYADDTFSNWQDIHKDRGGLPSSSTIRLGQSHIAGYLPAPKGDDD